MAAQPADSTHWLSLLLASAMEAAEAGAGAPAPTTAATPRSDAATLPRACDREHGPADSADAADGENSSPPPAADPRPIVVADDLVAAAEAARLSCSMPPWAEGWA